MINKKLIISIFLVVLLLYVIIHTKIVDSNQKIKSKYARKFRKNNITICLFLPSAIDDFPFVQGIITSVDTFWPSGIGKKIHWIDNFKGKTPFKYENDWNVIYAVTPNISVPVMKQQYNSYISYKYCSDNKFVAMIDSDSVFITYVKYEMLFNNNNTPFILYTLKYRDKRWDPRKILKTNNSMWGDVMFTYPIIIKKEHVQETMKYVEYIHNNSLINLMEKYIFGQFGTFLECIHIMNYKNQYSLINVEESAFPPRCSIHIPYSYIEVNWGKVQRIKVEKHKNAVVMNKLIYYLIQQGECSEKTKRCKNFEKKKFEKNLFTIEEKYKHYFLKA